MKNTLYGLAAAALLAAAPAAFGQETAAAKHTVSHVHGTRVSSVTDTDSLKATMDSEFSDWSGNVGTNFLKVPAGKQIALTYRAYAESGDFKIVLRNKEGETFWEEALPLRSEAVVQRTLPVAKDGEYHVNIAGAGSKGKFNVSWTVK
ncbi:MAG: hypothetical protein ICV83_12085 [Cytophagales bacterium]|nr:hypothetical protein [Cytophagales bacterium]